VTHPTDLTNVRMRCEAWSYFDNIIMALEPEDCGRMWAMAMGYVAMVRNEAGGRSWE
jgi:hypothetical protein